MSKNSSGDALPLPPDLPQSTVSEIASWLVGLPLDAVERELICQTLEACGGDRAAAASVLGISLPALRKKITAYAVRGQPIPGTETNANRKPRAKTAPVLEPEKQDAADAALQAAPEVAEAPAAAGAEPAATGTPAQPEIPAPSEIQTDEFTPLAARVLEAARAERTVPPPSAEIVSFPAPPARDVLDPRGIDAPRPDDFAFAEDASARAAATPEPTLTVPPAANDLQPAAVLPPPPAAPRRAFNTRLLIAAGLVALLVAPIAYGLLKETPKNAAPASLDRVQLQVSVREQPLPQPLEQRIAVPAWVMPPERGATPPVAAERAAPAPAAPPVFAPDTSADVAMELGPVNMAADVAMPLTPPNSDGDVHMALTPPDTSKDVAMALAPPDAEHDVAMPLGPADIAADARMEPGDWHASLAAADADEATGSIPAATFFKAPARAPMPRERLDPDEQPRRVAARPRAPAPEPARAEPPGIEGLFPFNLFAPREGRKNLLGSGTN